MKKLLYLLFVAGTLFLTGCGVSNQAKLCGNLQTYMVLRSDYGDTLFGVKNKTEEVVPAGKYATITADKNVIICCQDDSMFDVFLHDGTPLGLGQYSAFNLHAVGKKKFYIGGTADSVCCFFPKSETLIGLEVFATKDNVFILQDSDWNVYSLDGVLLNSFPASAQFIKDEGSEDVFVAVSVTRRKICTSGTIYAPDGRLLHKYNVFRWRKFQRSLSFPVVVNHVSFYEVNASTIFNL